MYIGVFLKIKMSPSDNGIMQSCIFFNLCFELCETLTTTIKKYVHMCVFWGEVIQFKNKWN